MCTDIYVKRSYKKLKLKHRQDRALCRCPATGGRYTLYTAKKNQHPTFARELMNTHSTLTPREGRVGYQGVRVRMYTYTADARARSGHRYSWQRSPRTNIARVIVLPQLETERKRQRARPRHVLVDITESDHQRRGGERHTDEHMDTLAVRGEWADTRQAQHTANSAHPRRHCIG
jgi:hypothetical protein